MVLLPAIPKDGASAGEASLAELQARASLQQDAKDREELQARIQKAIAFAALELDQLFVDEEGLHVSGGPRPPRAVRKDSKYPDVDTERLEIIQRAHIKTTLGAHEEEREKMMGIDWQNSNADLERSQKIMLSFAEEVEEVDADLEEREKEIDGEEGVLDAIAHRTQREREHHKPNELDVLPSEVYSRPLVLSATYPSACA